MLVSFDCERGPVFCEIDDRHVRRSGSAHSQPASDTAPAATSDPLADLRRGVFELIGEPSCTATAECRTMAFGAKPCGGPRSYLAFSIAATDSQRLVDAVRRFTEQDEANNRERGLMSDCSVVEEPEVTCSSGLCSSVR